MRLRLTLATAILASACVAPMPTAAPQTATAPSASSAAPFPTTAPSLAGAGSVLLVGRIVTMADPPEVEAILIVDGRVAAMGSRAAVEASAPPGTKMIELGANVAYPGFIDAHSHWIGDREHYGVGSAQDAMQAAVSRGWTSIAELWVNQDRLAELEELDRGGLPLRVDAYLAANHPGPGWNPPW